MFATLRACFPAMLQPYHLVLSCSLSPSLSPPPPGKQTANSLGIPWTAWTLHMRCPPSLLQDLSNYGCGVGMPLRLTAWGELIKKYL